MRPELDEQETAQYLLTYVYSYLDNQGWPGAGRQQQDMK